MPSSKLILAPFAASRCQFSLLTEVKGSSNTNHEEPSGHLRSGIGDAVEDGTVALVVPLGGDEEIGKTLWDWVVLASDSVLEGGLGTSTPPCWEVFDGLTPIGFGEPL